jgi:hypothetical protein
MTRWVRVPVLIRLVAKVDRLYGELPEDYPELGPCWPFLGARTPKGHGKIRDDDGKLAYAHRIALAAALGRPLRPGMLACHRCNYKPCCRPSHLYEGTKADNEQDKWYAMREPLFDRIIGVDAVLEAVS